MAAKRRRVDIKEMTDDEVRSLIAEATRRERWMPGGYSERRRNWTALRLRGDAELERRADRSSRNATSS
jgi:hypothetical protein